MPNNSMFIYNMSYQKIEALGKILDNKETWKTLGGLMEYDTQTIQEFERSERQGKSPTIELLNDWSKKNHTVFELFTLLYKMEHFQAMMVLKPLVEEKYHHLIYYGKDYATELSDAACGPPVPNLSVAKGMEFAEDKTLAYGENNWNVMLPEVAKLSKESYPDSQPKIQNLRSPVSMDENNLKQEQRPAPSGSAPTAVGARKPVVNLEKLEGGFEKLHLSPAGIAALAAGQQQSPSVLHTAQNQNYLALNLASPFTPQRKLSDASLAASRSECSTLPQCDYKDLEAATQNWSRSCIVGRGGFGTVFVGNWKNTKVAIKRLELPKGQTKESQEVEIQQSLTELSILQSIRHDNILQLYGFSLGGTHPCLVYQFMENGSLEDRLQRKDTTKYPLEWQQRYNIARGTAKGVQYLHTVLDKPLIHGDIKSANILLDSNFEPRIGDFGLAREGPQTQYTHMEVSRVHGTKPYLPDEFLRSKKLSTKVDTYSFGVVLFELTTGQRAYEEKRTNKLLKDEVTSRPREKLFELVDLKAGNSCVEYFEPMILLGIKCVSKNTKERPEMEEVWRTLDQLQIGGKGQASPLELQKRYEQWNLQRQQSQSQSPQVPAPVGNSNLHARNKLTAFNSINGHPLSVSPPNVGQRLSQGVSHAGGQTRPNYVPESNRLFAYAAGSGNNLFVPINAGQITNHTAAENCPHQIAIAVLPATGSDISAASSSRSSVVSSSVYSSHTSQNELESQGGEEDPENILNIPLLSTLGTRQS